MGNLADYKKVCHEHIERVQAIRSKHDEKVANLKIHLGSEYGKEETVKENEMFKLELQAAQDSFTADIDKVLSAMKTKLEENEEQVIPPSEEQLRLLTAVSLMSTVDLKDYLNYLKACSSSDVAARALSDLAQERAGEDVAIPKYIPPYDSAYEQAKLLTDNARNLARWDGETSAEALSKFLDERTAKGLPVSARHDTRPAGAGSADPTSTNYFKDILGLRYDEGSLSIVD